MHTGYFTSWPPRIDTLDSLGDLHQPRMSPSLANSQKKKSSSASAPSSPRAGPSFFSSSSRSQSGTAVDVSLPSSPTPQRTATAPTPHRRTLGPRMSARALSTDSINTDALGFRNAIAGGMLTSPSGVPTTNYLPTFLSSTPSTPFEHPSSASPRTATGSASGSPVEVTGGSAHLISFGAPYGLYRTSSGGRPPMVRSNSSKKRETQQRPSYHPFGSMKSSYSPRMAPFSDPEGASSGTGTGTGTANRQGGGFSEFNNAGQWFQPSNLRKSVSAGKPAKKGLKSRLRKLRHRQGSSSREGLIAFTSGESDSEAAFEKEPETIFNSGGIAQRYSSFRVKQPSTSTDPSLPPPPPHPFVGSTKHSPLSNTSTEPTSTGMESHKEPSHMRFKDLFKGVGVGLSNQHSPSSGNRGMPGFPTLDHRGSHKSSKSLQAGTSFREFLSGDDQPSHSNALRMGKRRRRLTKKSHSLANGMLRPAATDDEDSSTPKSVGGGLLNLTMREGGSRHGGHKHHTFLSPFQPRRRSRSTGEEGRRELQSVWMPDTAATPSSVPSQSLALRNARLEHKNNPNVFVTELPPLPESFVREFKALAPVSKSHGSPPHHSQTPSVSHITPSSTAGSGMSTSTVPVPQFYGSQHHVKLQQHQLLIHQLQHQQQLHHQLHQQLQQQNHATTKAAIAAFVSKTFLFESLQNSKFQGYYIFRVVGDHVEYRKLPMGLNALCGQYFRDTYVTYRGLEAKTKALREERERSLKFGSIWNASSQPPTDPGLQHGVSEPMVTTLGKFATVDGSSGEMSRTTATREDPGWHSASEERSGDILRSAVAWDTASPHHGALARPQSSPHKRSTGYLEQRYNPEGTLNNALVKSIIGVPDRTSNKLEPLLVKLEKSGLRLEKGGLHRSGTKNASFSGPLSAGGHFYNGNNVYSGDLASPKAVAGRPMAFIPQRPSLHPHRKRSWTGTKEQQRIDMERRRLEEEERWNKAEQKHREEVYQTTYGPQLFLNEIVHEFEYERFDASAVVTILNDNPDTAVFSIINGDKTNVMRLESPHARLKNEFLNRLAISRMDHGECEAKRNECTQAQRERSSIDQFMKMEQDRHYDLDDPNEEVDTLLEIVDLRIALQEENLRCVRESIQETMKEIEESLDSLDHLNDKAKKLMTDMIRAIDSQEVQLALRPSMTTGLTLAETVEWKLKDVNERIVICTRIMLAAKDNLNRLKYEIELEQRSIRLFRQYKIVIAVISFSVVFLVWSLYHSRASAMAPQPASPLFSSAVNPFEVDHTFHHGEPPILPSPTSIPNFADVGDHVLGEEACPMSLFLEHLEL